MTSTRNAESVNIVSNILERVHGKGVRLWSENGQLRFKAPKGALTREEITQLQSFKRVILEFLQGANAVEASGTVPTDSSLHKQYAPMTFSQLAHWNLYRLDQRRSLRQIASATRLCGNLDLDTFHHSLAHIVHRHDALRTRIVSHAGALMQEITPTLNPEVSMEDLSSIPLNQRYDAVLARIQEFILERIDVSRDSLFAVKLLKTSAEEHVLILTLEHMISDAVSMGVLLRELLTTYADMLANRPSRLPPIQIQFADYAAWRAAMQPDWTQKHGEYWRQRLTGCGRLRFPCDVPPSTPTKAGWDSIPVPGVSHLKGRLNEWSRTQKTTLVMTVFTAYAALVLRWCEAPAGLIQYLTDGRAHPSTQHTIGFFAFALHLKVELLEFDSFLDMLNRISLEYCTAHEHADQAFMESRTPRPDFACNTCFNWVPYAPKFDLANSNSSEATLTYQPLDFEHPMLKILERDNEPMALFFDAADTFSGAVYFPVSRFSAALMERFTRNLIVFIEKLISDPDARIKDIPLLP